MKPLLLTIVIVVVVAAGAWWIVWQDVRPPAPEAPTTATEEPRAENAAPVQAPAPTPLPAPVPTQHPAAPQTMLELPDGMFVPCLNGATNAGALATAWDPQLPYAKIVAKERASDGVEWYVHADGTRSTTRMIYRSDLGRMDAVTSVGHPGVALRVMGKR